MEFLLLIYKIPSEPTRLRAAVWRKVKNIGALYIQNSVCILPANKESERHFRQLKREIEEMGGESYLFRSGLIASPDNIVIDLFNLARDEEYGEIVDKCQDFFREIEKEINNSHFSYAELEENEEDLEKLRKWYEKVVVRDVFGAKRRSEAEEFIQHCRDDLDHYSDLVFNNEDNK